MLLNTSGGHDLHAARKVEQELFCLLCVVRLPILAQRAAYGGLEPGVNPLGRRSWRRLDIKPVPSAKVSHNILILIKISVSNSCGPTFGPTFRVSWI